MNLKIRMHAAPTISRARLMNKHLTEQTSPILPIFLHKSQKIKNSFFIMQTADRSYKTQITQQKRVHWFGAIRFWCNFNWFLIKFVTKFEQKSIKIAPKSNRTKPMSSSLEEFAVSVWKSHRVDWCLRTGWIGRSRRRPRGTNGLADPPLSSPAPSEKRPIPWSSEGSHPLSERTKISN